ncbi:MAG: sugar transferase [Acidimicrobiales bacterium]
MALAPEKEIASAGVSALDDPNHGALEPRPTGTRARSVDGVNAKLVMLMVDLIAVMAALWLSVQLNARFNPGDPTAPETYFALLMATLPVWPIAFTGQALYKARFITRGVDEGWRTIKAIMLSIVSVGIASIALGVPIDRGWYGLAIPTMLAVVGAERVVARVWFRRSRRSGKLLRRVLIVGKNAEGWLMKEMLDADRSLGYDVVGFVEDYFEADGVPSQTQSLRDTDRTLETVKRLECGGVVIAATAMDVGISNRLIRTLTDNDVHVELSSTLCDIASDRLTIRPLGRFPMVYIEPVRRHGWRAKAKQAFDLTVATGLLVAFLPLLAVVVLAIKLTSRGPVFFAQERVGRDGKLFKVLKFRTMVDNAEDLLDEVRHLNEANGPLFKIKDDPRITGPGRILRKSSIDELPQLINVLRGEMSMVGPRPALPSEREQWDPSLHNRLRVKPGITGMWQVNGRSNAEGGDYGQLDLYYVDNWTLVTDLLIMLRTIPAVLFQRGAH